MTDSVIVTGGARHLGSHMVAELAAARFRLLIVDNFATSSTTILPRLRRITGPSIPCVTADTRGGIARERLFAEHAVSGAVHCAWFSTTRTLERYDRRNLRRRVALADPRIASLRAAHAMR